MYILDKFLSEYDTQPNKEWGPFSRETGRAWEETLSLVSRPEHPFVPQELWILEVLGS